MKIKRLIFNLLIIMLIFSCQKDKNEVSHNRFTITGITSSDDHKLIYLLNNESNIIDSSEITKLSFKFRGTVKESSSYHLKFKNNTKTYPIILDNNKFIVFISNDNAKIYGGKLNNKLNKFIQEKNTLDKKKLSLINEFIDKKITSKKFEKDVLLIDQEKEKSTLVFLQENKNNLLSSKVLTINKDLLLKDLLKLKSTINDATNISFISILNNRILKQQKNAENKRVKEKAAIEAKRLYRKPATMFSGEGLNYEEVSLRAIIKGKKAVLIDFWASWCGPCRMVTPSLIMLYEKYKDKGFTILTVSEDKTKEAWKKGIKEDKMLAWNHIYDDFSRISNMNGVEAIPYMILIDGKGKIIKEKITYTELVRQLEKICK